MTTDPAAASGRVELRRPKRRFLTSHRLWMTTLVLAWLVLLGILLRMVSETTAEPPSPTASFLAADASTGAGAPSTEPATGAESAGPLGAPRAAGPTRTITAWFLTTEAIPRLRAVEQRVAEPSDRRELVATLVDVLQGPPPSPELRSPLPPGTKALGVFGSGGDLYLDLSAEFIRDHDGGTGSALGTLQALTATLAGVEGVRRVKLLVSGKERVTLRGHFDLMDFWPAQAPARSDEEPHAP